MRNVTFRHGTIDFRALDLGIRRYDCDSHLPSFLFFSMTNQRSRDPVLSDAREARKQRKKQKLEDKKAQKTG